MRANVAHCWMICFALSCAGLFARNPAPAQDAKPPTSDKKQSSFGEDGKDGQKFEEKKFDIPYWDRSESFQIRASIALVGEGNPLGVLGARLAIGENVPTVQGWEFNFDKALPIVQNYLEVIRDGRPLPDMRAKELIDLKVPDRGLYLAYLQALRRSHSATLEMFQRSAEENEKVVYTHLATNPRLYRGKVIQIKGKLTAIRAVEAPPLLQTDGILEIYTSWIIGPTKGAPPFAIVFTHMPKGLGVSEKLNAEVTFQGYFLSNILIPADKERGGSKQDLICPWLIGKTVIAADAPPDIEPTIASRDSYEVAIYIFGVIFGIGVLIGLLNLYFRRSDQKTQSRLAELRDKHQPFKLDENPPNELNGPKAESPDGDWPGVNGK